MNMIHVGITGGRGRMGRVLLQEILTRKDMQLAAVSVREDTTPITIDGHSALIPATDPEILFRKSDIVIDFTTPQATAIHVPLAQKLSKPLVICTTGFDESLQRSITHLSRTVPVMVSPNTSLGIAVLAQLTQKAAHMLGPDFDIEIIDIHHRHKKDAPSGTAKYLHRQLATDRPAPIHSLRLGGIPGDHTVIFSSQTEVLSFTHRALDRALFAQGALNAAKWLVDQKPGLYEMRDMLKNDA